MLDTAVNTVARGVVEQAKDAAHDALTPIAGRVDRRARRRRAARRARKGRRIVPLLVLALAGAADWYVWRRRAQRGPQTAPDPFGDALQAERDGPHGLRHMVATPGA